MQLFKKLRLHSITALVCTAFVSLTFYTLPANAQFGGGIGVELPVLGEPVAPTEAPTTTQDSIPLNTNFVITMPEVPQLFGDNTGITYYELLESRDFSVFTRIANVDVSNGFTVTHQLDTAGEAYYKYRICNNIGCSAFSPTKTITVTGGTSGGGGSTGGSSWYQKAGTVPNEPLVTPTASVTNFHGVMNSEGGVSGGAASYSIPVTLPPGRAGIEPSVSVNYSSRSGNGIAGVGWSLSAAGAISRCSATEAQDGFTSGVWFQNSTDRLCMNGQRLVAVSGGYGNSGTVYRTEIDSFVRVTQRGGALSSSSSYFEVEYNSGEKGFYGQVSAARVSPTGTGLTLSWLANRMQDASGKNHMTYLYTNYGHGEVLLNRINYTGNGTSDGNRSVRFSYENRAKYSTSYIAGAYTRQTKRLKTISTYYGSSKVRDYTLNYAISGASGRSLLTSVQECGHQRGRQCRQAASFDWSDDAARYKLERLTTRQGHELAPVDILANRDFSLYVPRGDMNGDGVRDWSGYFVDAEGNYKGTNTAVAPQCQFNKVSRQVQCINDDFNRDGLTDSWRVENNRVRIGYSNGSTFNWNSPGLTPIEIRDQVGIRYNVNNIADYNGDGWPDVIVHEAIEEFSTVAGPVGFGGNVVVYLHTGNPNAPYSSKQVLYSLSRFTSVQYAGDLNNDGLPDFTFNRRSNTRTFPHIEDIVLTKVASNGSLSLERHPFNSNLRSFNDLFDDFSTLVDINADGLLDWVGTVVGHGLSLRGRINQGNGTFGAHFGLGYTLTSRDVPKPGTNPFEPDFIFSPKFAGSIKQMDVDGDGRTELIIPSGIVRSRCARVNTGNGVLETRCGTAIYDPVVQGGNAYFAIPPEFDNSTYSYKALHFVEATNGAITTQVKSTNLVATLTSSVVIDAFGKGLPDLIFFNGCQAGQCTAPGSNAGMVENKSYVNRNYGAAVSSNPGANDYRAIDLMTSANNGVGLVSEWSYHPLTSGQPTSFYDTDFSFVDNDHFHFASSMYAVSEFKRSNGVGSKNTMRYQYRGAMYNTKGRGFRGFKTIIDTDVTRGTRTETLFKQKFPYSSLVERQRHFAGSRVLSDVRNTWATNTSHNFNGVVDVFSPSSQSFQYDLVSGAEIGRTTNTISQSDVDAYGNVRRQVQTVSDVFGTTTTTTTSAFSPQNTSSVWWPHRLTRTTVAKSIHHGSPIPVRHGSTVTSKTVTTHIAQYNTTHRKPQVVTVAPGSSARSQAQCDTVALNACQSVTTSYNTYGLPTSVVTRGSKITGNADTLSLEARTTTTTYTDSGTSASSAGYFPYEIRQLTGSRTLTQRITTEPRTGLPLSARDVSGVTVSTAYDSLARPTQVSTTGFPAQAIRYRTPDNNRPTGNGAVAIMMVERFQAGAPNSAEYIDRLGRTLRTRAQDFAGNNVYSDMRYDSLGRMTHESNLHTGSPVYTRYSGFDVLDRPSTKVTPSTQTNEDVTTSYIYDRLETRISTQAPDGLELNMRRSVNTQGQLISTRDDKGGITSYAYDAAGNPIVIRDAANNSIFANYDDIGRKLWVIDPNQGRTDFTYNDFGELDKEKDANNHNTRYEHDLLGRVTSRFGNNQLSATFVWDTVKHGLMTSESSAGATKTYAYDNAARPTSVSTNIEGKIYNVTTQYDGNYGRPKAMAYPNNLTVELEYNARGYLEQESNAASGYVYRKITAQDAWGNITQDRITNNQLTGSYSYSARTGQMLSTRVRKGTADRHFLSYSNYDSYGNVITQQNLANGANATETFIYDSLHRLTQSRTTGNGFTDTIDYSYDAVGNLKRKTDYSTTSTNAYQYQSGTNRLQSVALKQGGTRTFGYDAKGNLTHRNGVRENIYNVFNKPAQISRLGSTVNLSYGADLMRFKQVRTVNNQTIVTYYIDKLFEIEMTGSGTSATTKETTYLGDVAMVIENRNASGTITNRSIRFSHKDRLGSSATFTDHNGNVTTLRSYDPFGKPKGGDWSTLSSARLNANPQDSDIPTRRGFTDHEHLDEIEIIHMNGRVYDYKVGRFLSVDPVIVDPTNSQAINPYSYVMNNPLGYTDPSGYTADKVDPKQERRKTTGSRVARKTGDAGNFGNHGSRNSGRDNGAGGSGAGGNGNTPSTDKGNQGNIAKNKGEKIQFPDNGIERITVGCDQSCQETAAGSVGVEDVWPIVFLGREIGRFQAPRVLGAAFRSPMAILIGTVLSIPGDTPQNSLEGMRSSSGNVAGGDPNNEDPEDDIDEKDIANVKVEISRRGKPQIKVTMKDGSVRVISRARTKIDLPEPRATKGFRPKKFNNSLAGSKGKKRLPTKKEIQLLDKYTKK